MGKLLILSSDTGEGHNSAARTLHLAAQAAGIPASIRRPIEESSALNHSLANLYNVLLTHRQRWVGPYFHLINAARFSDRDIFYRLVRGKVRRFVESTAPGIVLSVHPMLNHFVQRQIRELGWNVPLYTLVTDPFPPFWRAWISPEMDRYFATTPDAAEALEIMGAPPNLIEVVPMPVRPQFRPASALESEAFREALHLDCAPVLLLNGGARGGGPILKLYQVIRQTASGLNVLVVCGRNERVRQRIERFRDPRTRAFGFLEDIHRFVGASDLVVTKPGAMSTFEALACRVPPALIGVDGLMPQESGLFAAAERIGFGFAIRTLDDLRELLRLGVQAWREKLGSIDNFYSPDHGGRIIERIQPAHVGT